MEKLLTLENPQERLSSLDFKIGWLASMIDGEGSISLTLQIIKGKPPYFVPNICISGTNKESIQRSIDFLKDIDIAYYVFTSTRKGTKMSINPKSQSNKDCSTIRIWGMKRANKLLKIITPYLTEKKSRAECVLAYSNRRIEKYENMMKVRGTMGKLQTYAMSFEDLLDYWNMRKLNNTSGKYVNSKSSESIRQMTYQILEKEDKLMMYSELIGDNKR